MVTGFASRAVSPCRRLGLRAVLPLIAAFLIAAPSHAQEPAVEFMKQASRELIAAAKSGTPQDFIDVIQKRGHVPAIGLYALGNYRHQLKPNERSTYYGGMVRFIARYASNEAPKYSVSHAEIFSPPVREGTNLFVDSRVFMSSVTSYDVRWMLVPQGNSFRIRDAQVLTFWMSPFLKNLFENYIGENGGNPQALVIALNR